MTNTDIENEPLDVAPPPLNPFNGGDLDQINSSPNPPPESSGNNNDLPYGSPGTPYSVDGGPISEFDMYFADGTKVPSNTEFGEDFANNFAGNYGSNEIDNGQLRARGNTEGGNYNIGQDIYQQEANPNVFQRLGGWFRR